MSVLSIISILFGTSITDIGTTVSATAVRLSTATSFTKATLVDQTTAGLAALINTKAEATVYTYAEVTMPDGVTVVKGIIPTAVVDLIS